MEQGDVDVRYDNLPVYREQLSVIMLFLYFHLLSIKLNYYYYSGKKSKAFWPVPHNDVAYWLLCDINIEHSWSGL